MDTINCAPDPLPVPLSGQNWIPIDAKGKNFSTTAVKTLPQANESRDAKTQKFRKKLKKWWKRTSQEMGTASNHSTDVNKAIETAANVAACPSENYGTLIREVILRSPTRTRSTTGICQDIMKSYDWYKLNRRSGWQEIIAEELTRNPSFQPVVECRKGVIIKSKSIKWQVHHQEEVVTPTRRESSSSFRPQSPVSLPPSVAELPAIPTPRAEYAIEIDQGSEGKVKGVDHKLSTLARSVSPLSVLTASSPPHYSDIGSLFSGGRESRASFHFEGEPGRSPLNSETIASRISSWMGESTLDTSYKLNWEDIKPKAEPRPSSIVSSPGRINKSKRIQLYDPPMEEDSYYRHAPQDGNGNSSSSSSPPANQQQNTTTASTPESGPEHPFTSGNRSSNGSDGNRGFSDDEDGNQDRKRKRFHSPRRKQNRRQFACVYHKFDPETYGVQNRRYLVCAGTGFEYVSELVRHLHRNHGEFICGKCLRSFDNGDLHRAHKQECTVRLRCSQEERWAGLWRARFPGIPVPLDPYLETPAKLSLPTINTNLSSPSEPPETAPGTSSPDCSTSSSTTLLDNPSPSTTTHSQGNYLAPPSSNGSKKEFGMPSPDSLKAMENRLDCLEKRLPFLEEALGFMLKLMRSMETTRTSASGIIASHVPQTKPCGFNHTCNPGAQIPVHPGSTPNFYGPSSFSFPETEAAANPPSQPHSEKSMNELLEGDTLSPELAPEIEKFINEMIEGHHRMSPKLQTPGPPDKTSNSNFPNQGKIGRPELMDLSSNELDLLLGNGHRHDAPSPYMDLMPDIQT